MHKVRICEKGWDLYTGYVGTVEFTNGISDRPLTPYEVTQIGASMRIEAVDSEEQVGPGVKMAASKHLSAEVVKAMPKGEPVTVEVTITKEEANGVAFEAIKAELGTYTREQLDSLAEKGGIKAIREVATKFGIKGVQISQMIDEIVQAQAPKEAE